MTAPLKFFCPVKIFPNCVQIVSVMERFFGQNENPGTLYLKRDANHFLYILISCDFGVVKRHTQNTVRIALVCYM